MGQRDQADVGVPGVDQIAAGVVRALPVVADDLVAVEAVDAAVQQYGRCPRATAIACRDEAYVADVEQEPVDQALLDHLTDRLLGVVLDVPQDHVLPDRAEHPADLVQQLGVERARHARHEHADGVGPPGLHRPGQRIRNVVRVLQYLQNPGPGLRVDLRIVGQHPRNRGLGHPCQPCQIPARRWS